MKTRKNFTSRLARSLGLGRPSDMLVIEQFRLIAKQIPVLYSVIIVNCAFMAVLAATQVDGMLAFAFPGAASPIMIYRIVLWRRHARELQKTRDYGRMRRALRSTTILANVMAVILAIWSVLLLGTVAPHNAAFVPVFTILSMITCAYCLSAYPIAAYSVMLSGSTYIALAMVWTGDPFLLAMALNIGLVSIMVVYMVGHQYGQLQHLVHSSDKLKRQRSQAKFLAYQDQLTGLPNRRALIEQIRREERRGGVSGPGLIMLDLNGFKPVNDTFGHRAGDQLLITTSLRLQDVVGERGLVSRLGGDEFCVFLPRASDSAVVLALAERISSAIREPLVLDGHLLHLGVAIGVAVGAGVPRDPLGLLQSADIALYEAKSLGGNAICRFEQRMEARVRRRTLIEQALADTNQIEAIELQYQPIFAMRSNHMVAYEALARWEHPVLGRISPSEFIEVAERNGLARRLTLHLFRQAVAKAVAWEQPLYLSFNLSGSGLCTAGFEDSLPAILEELGFPPQRLVIEVTETALLGDPAAAWAVLDKLKQRGVKIVLDDFGAGYASIGYLRDLQLDGIKLDGSLIREITTNSRSRRLLLGVLQLCRSLGVEVTAEEIETAEQLEALQAFPIDYVQGFYLGRPGSGGRDSIAPDSAADPLRRAS